MLYHNPIYSLIIKLRHNRRSHSFAWEDIAKVIKDIVRGQALVILHACNSSSAAASFESVMSTEKTINLVNRHPQHMAVLAASSWNTTTPAFGANTLIKKLVRAMCSLSQAQQGLSVIELYNHISRQSLWQGYGQPFLIASPGASCLTIPVNYSRIFSDFHLERANHPTTKKLMSRAHELTDMITGQEKHVKLKAMIMLSRMPFKMHCRPQCGDKVLTITDSSYLQTANEVLQDWRRHTSLRTDVVVSFQYFGRSIEPDEPLLLQLEAIKKEYMGERYAKDNIYRIGVTVRDLDDIFGGVARGCLMSEMCRESDILAHGLPCGENERCDRLLDVIGARVGRLRTRIRIAQERLRASRGTRIIEQIVQRKD